ncbi:hypothetical protein OAO56_03905, partial [Amylibacter sp.]|nr:hypothetical protein [Amylibacter sp.]
YDGITPAFKNLNNFIEIRDKAVEYIGKNSTLERNFLSKFRRIKHTSFYAVFLCELRYYFNIYDSYHPAYPDPIMFQLRLFYQQLKKIVQQNYGSTLDSVKSDKKKGLKIVLYLEHFHPEASYSASNFDLRNDFENILNIAANLPSDCKLVVKLHPSNNGRIANKHYKSVMKASGVTFIKSNENVKSLLDLTDLVVSLNSTVIVDAARQGVSSIVLGELEVIDGCVGAKKINGFSQIKQFLIHQIKQKAYLKTEWFASHNFDVYLWSKEFPKKLHDAICDESKHF